MKTMRVRSVIRARKPSTSAVNARFRHRDRRRADRHGADRVHQEAVPAVEDFGARTGIARSNSAISSSEPAPQTMRAGSSP